MQDGCIAPIHNTGPHLKYVEEPASGSIGGDTSICGWYFYNMSNMSKCGA